MTTSTPSSLRSHYRLTPADQNYFDRNGFIKLRGALDPEEVRGIAPLITDKVIELNTQHLPVEERDTYGKAFLQVSNLWQEDAGVESIVRSPDLARLAAELLGVDSVRLYHDQALYKEPSGGITPWHADQYYWPFDRDRCVTIWIPLQDTPSELGPLSFAAGSHTEDFGRDLPISDESEAEIAKQLAESGYVIEDSAYALGDASYHLGWTFHRAGANTSDRPRRIMTMIYVDADAVVTEPTNEHQVTDIQRWMPGCAPGDVVASPLNPVLWPVQG